MQIFLGKLLYPHIYISKQAALFTYKYFYASCSIHTHIFLCKLLYSHTHLSMQAALFTHSYLYASCYFHIHIFLGKLLYSHTHISRQAALFTYTYFKASCSIYIRIFLGKLLYPHMYIFLCKLLFLHTQISMQAALFTFIYFYASCSISKRMTGLLPALYKYIFFKTRLENLIKSFELWKLCTFYLPDSTFKIEERLLTIHVWFYNKAVVFFVYICFVILHSSSEKIVELNITIFWLVYNLDFRIWL